MRRIAQREALRTLPTASTAQLDPDALPDVKDFVGEAQAAIDLHTALRRLTAGERRVVWLHYWCDLPCREVAAALGLPVGTVKIRLFRGRARLRAALAEASTASPLRCKAAGPADTDTREADDAHR